MKITILGSGTYQPQLNIANSSYLIQVAKKNLVFDFGRGCINQLLRCKVNYYDIDSIFITHAHADHCCDLSSFLHVALAEPYKAQNRKKDLTIYGPIGIKDTINNILTAFHLSDKKPKYKIIVKEIKSEDSVTNPNWTVKCFEAKHADINCLSYRIEAENKAIAYSGDNSDCKGLRDCCKEVDLVIMEANSPVAREKGDHLTGEKAGKIAQDSNVKTLVLTHISVDYHENFNAKKEAEKYFKGNVVIAKDLMKFEL